MPDMLTELRVDHRNMALLLDLLEQELRVMSGVESPDFELMRDIMTYMSRYPDYTHHPKEDVLISHVVTLDPRARPLAERLEREHPALAEKGTALLDVLRRVTDGALVERAELDQKSHDYVAFLRAHMRFEDLEVFPLAETLLGSDDWSLIEARIVAQRDPVFGAVVADEFVALYAHIERQGFTR